MAEEMKDIRDLLMGIAAESTGPVTAGGWYSQAGDCVFFHLEDVPYVGVWVDDLLTVYEAIDDRRVVGLQIKAVSRLPKHNAVEIKVDGNEISVALLILATWNSQKVDATAEPARARRYFDAARSFIGGRAQLAALL